MSQQTRFGEGVVGQGVPVGAVVANGLEVGHHRVGLRPLNGQQSHVVALVCEDDVEAALLDLALNPLPILGTVARIHHEHVLVLVKRYTSMSSTMPPRPLGMHAY